MSFVRPLVCFLLLWLILGESNGKEGLRPSQRPSQSRPSTTSNIENARRGPPQENQCSLDYSVDYLLLSLQWPTSFCHQHQRCSRDIDPNKWQIHGLWPQRKTFGQNPQFCCLRSRFDSRKLDPIRHQLVEKWKSSREDGRHDQFWRHEWNKHGSCAQRLSRNLSDQFQFFNTTLSLYDMFPLSDWFRKTNVLPSNDRLYSVDDIHHSIERHLKSRVRLECSVSPDPRPNSPPILSEVHICLERTHLKAIDCHNRDDRQCFINGPNNPILFPKHWTCDLNIALNRSERFSILYISQQSK